MELRSHLEYDTKKGYTNNITTADIQTLFVSKHTPAHTHTHTHGECLKCGEFIQTCGYSKGDKKRFQLIELTARKDKTKTSFKYFISAVIVPRKVDLGGFI